MASIGEVQRVLREKKSGGLKFSELSGSDQSALKNHARTSTGGDQLTLAVRNAIADKKY